MYDDIAYNKENPMKGVIMNRPNGTNVYKGVPKDYTNKTVTPGQFPMMQNPVPVCTRVIPKWLIKEPH